MLKMYINEIELEPVGIGAQKGNVNGEEVLVLTFRSEKQLSEIVDMLTGLADDTKVMLKNEKHEYAYPEYVSLHEEIKVSVNKDGTYNYTAYLKKKSALEIAQQAAADVEYLAAVSGVEL